MASRSHSAPVGTHIDRRIRYAVRILENEQTSLPETADVATRVGLFLFHFVRLFGEQVGLKPKQLSAGDRQWPDSA